MQSSVETGTDVAQLLVFDPLALPEDYDRSPSHQKEIIRKLHDAQSIFYIETGADGGYLFHAFIDEPISEYLRPFMCEPRTQEHFNAPSGRIFFTGLEYAFRSDDSRLRKHPHMGGSITVSPGPYRLSVYRTEYPENLIEEELRQKVDARAFKLHQNMGCFVELAVLGVIAAVGTFPFLRNAVWFTGVLPLAGIFLAMPLAVHQLPAYRTTDQIWRDVQRRYPSLVADFQKNERAERTV